ncbi:MAG: hypothetical protein ACE5HD_13100 [Acidobacteriota bacterium]
MFTLRRVTCAQVRLWEGQLTISAGSPLTIGQFDSSALTLEFSRMQEAQVFQRDDTMAPIGVYVLDMAFRAETSPAEFHLTGLVNFSSGGGVGTIVGSEAMLPGFPLDIPLDPNDYTAVTAYRVPTTGFEAKLVVPAGTARITGSIIARAV